MFNTAFDILSMNEKFSLLPNRFPSSLHSLLNTETEKKTSYTKLYTVCRSTIMSLNIQIQNSKMDVIPKSYEEFSLHKEVLTMTRNKYNQRYYNKNKRKNIEDYDTKKIISNDNSTFLSPSKQQKTNTINKVTPLKEHISTEHHHQSPTYSFNIHSKKIYLEEEVPANNTSSHQFCLVNYKHLMRKLSFEESLMLRKDEMLLLLLSYGSPLFQHLIGWYGTLTMQNNTKCKRRTLGSRSFPKSLLDLRARTRQSRTLRSLAIFFWKNVTLNK